MAECALLTATRPIQWIAYARSEDQDVLTVGKEGVKAIAVVTVAGQGGYVPWFRVDYEDGTHRLVNAAFLEDVGYET